MMARDGVKEAVSSPFRPRRPRAPTPRELFTSAAKRAARAKAPFFCLWAEKIRPSSGREVPRARRLLPKKDWE